MRIAIANIGPALDAAGEVDTYESNGSRGYFFEGHVLDGQPAHKLAEGEFVHFKGNFKNPPAVGTTEDFELRLKQDGNKTSFRDNAGNWRVVVGRAKRDNSRAGNPYNGAQNAQRAPQGHATGQAAAHVAAAPRVVPTVTERGQALLALLPRGIKIAAHVAPEGATPDGILQTGTSIAMNWIISLERGEIRPDPTQAEIDAAAAAAQEAADAAAAEARRLADEAAARAKAAIPQRSPAGGPPVENYGYTERNPNDPDGVVF